MTNNDEPNDDPLWESPTTPVDEPPTAEPTTPVDEPPSSTTDPPASTDVTLEVELSADMLAYLAVLAPLGDESTADLAERASETLTWFCEHARNGIMRPGSWERGWLCRAFSGDFVDQLERTPDGQFDRPKPPRQKPPEPAAEPTGETQP